MRYLVVCNGSAEAAVIAEGAHRFVQPTDRLITLSSRRGSAWESGSILSIALRWALKNSGSPYWHYRNRARKGMSLVGGVSSARYFLGLEDLLMQIDACDPDVIDLRRLGKFGKWLKPRCAVRFPGRSVIADGNDVAPTESLKEWRTYDPTALVSIVLPTFNCEKYLSLAIDSCLQQTHKNFELIIIDDNSTDGTRAVIEKYSNLDSRIQYLIRKDGNQGLPEALNVGFDMAKGPYLTWFQSDNLYTCRAIEYMVQQLCTFTKIGFVYCSTHFIHEADDPTALLAFTPTLPPTALARMNVINGAFMYRREVMQAIGPYRPECRYYEDLDFFIRACARFPAKFYFEPCHFYRNHSGSLTTAHSDGGRKWKVWNRKMYVEHFASGRNRVILPAIDELLPVLPH
jgi:GT2 family glycosyltransferase